MEVMKNRNLKSTEKKFWLQFYQKTMTTTQPTEPKLH